MTKNRPIKPAGTPGPNLKSRGIETMNATVAINEMPAVMTNHLRMGRQAWLRAKAALSKSAASGV